MTQSHALLILGMHRSGTSALTGALALRGMHLGNDLMPPAAENPKGFWEHMGVVNIHEQLLDALGYAWNDPRPLPDGWLHHSATATAREQLCALIQAEFNTCPVWAIKDPRLCRLLPLWRPLLEDMGIKASVVMIIRDPREVADSLQQRNQWPALLARELWLRHLADAIDGSHGLPRCVLTYSRLLADPMAEIEAIADSLHLHLPAPETEYAGRLHSFIESHHRHHQAPTSIPEEWVLATSLYRQMLRQPVPWDELQASAMENILTNMPLSHALAEYAELHSKQQRVFYQTQDKLNKTQHALNHAQHELESTRNELVSTHNELESSRNELVSTHNELESTRNELERTGEYTQ